MDKDNYLKERLDPQIKWYDKKAKKAKFFHYSFRIIEIILAACIPFLTPYFNTLSHIPLTISLIGCILTLIYSIHNFLNFQENWIEYRKNAELLKHERYMFLANSGIYNNSEEIFKIFVERIETIISHENINWAQLNYKDYNHKN